MTEHTTPAIPGEVWTGLTAIERTATALVPTASQQDALALAAIANTAARLRARLQPCEPDHGENTNTPEQDLAAMDAVTAGGGVGVA